MKLRILKKMLVVLLILTAHAVNGNSSSRGAFWGGVTGAAIGGSAGGPTGAILGGLGGAAVGGSIGASRDRQRYEYVDQYGRPVHVRRVYRRPVRRVVTRQVITQPAPKAMVKPKDEVIYVN
jgi:uncharacterized protein YcfJ